MCFSALVCWGPGCSDAGNLLFLAFGGSGFPVFKVLGLGCFGPSRLHLVSDSTLMLNPEPERARNRTTAVQAGPDCLAYNFRITVEAQKLETQKPQSLRVMYRESQH